MPKAVIIIIIIVVVIIIVIIIIIILFLVTYLGLFVLSSVVNVPSLSSSAANKPSSH